MRIHINFEIKAGAAGGGNQFLKALKYYLEKQGLYETSQNPD